MISINKDDYNLPSVLDESKLFNFITKNKFYVYGLMQQNNSPILIEFNNDIVDDAFRNNLAALVAFFKLNGIEVETFDKCQEHVVNIGFRRDLRAILNKQKKPIFAASVLSTIVYTLENRLDADKMKTFKLPAFPALPPKTAA